MIFEFLQYSAEEVRATEREILKALNFDLGRPLPIHFLRRYSRAANADALLHAMSKYFIDLALNEYSTSHVYPSMMAAGCLYLAKTLLAGNRGQWDNTMMYYTRYTEQDLQEFVARIAQILIKINRPDQKYKALREKYASPKFLSVSAHACLESNLIKEIAAMVS